VLQNTSDTVKTLRPGHGYTDDTRQVMLYVRSEEQPWNLEPYDDRFLDAIDAALRWVDWREDPLPDVRSRKETPRTLERLLKAANSVWRVSEQFDGLENRIDPTVTKAFETAAAAHPTAGDHLANAWKAAYGLHPDPDKAYDEAVLAVEALACPLVCPRDPRRSLGTVVRDLRAQATKWELAIGDTRTNRPAEVGPMLAMLEQLWFGQSRHEGSANSRSQTQIEGESAIQLAATLVRWLSSGVLRLK
jgi:hypothetical protein